jgi:NTP pyrophosphatase (non-canonical NTP hydrolase)
MKTLLELQTLIIEWANERDLIKYENAPKQQLKLLEEMGETAKAILKNDVNEQKDGLGDVFVVLVILAEQLKKHICFDIKDFNDETNLEFHELFSDINSTRIYFCLGYLDDIANKLNLDLVECANIAWNEIKNRKGKTVNGTFIKNE